MKPELSIPLLPTTVTSMKTGPVKMLLSLVFLLVFALRIGNSSQNINNDEDHGSKCTMYVSDVYQKAVEEDCDNKAPKGTKIPRKLFPKVVSKAISTSLR